MSVIFEQSYFGVVPIAQLVEVADGAVLGGVVEIVSSIPKVGHKNIFSIYRHSYFIISLQINLHYKFVSVSEPMWLEIIVVVKLYFSNAYYYLVSLAFSESDNYVSEEPRQN